MSELKLNFSQRLLISKGYHVPIGKQTRPGWKGYLMFYAFKCEKHGIVTDYPHGHRQRFTCPKCTESLKVE